MAGVAIERLGEYVDEWVRAAPNSNDIDKVHSNAIDALVEANMVQYNPEGWEFKLHEQNPDAPKARFKLMIREAHGVDTNPDYYDRFTLPAVLQADEKGLLSDLTYVLGYPNAGTPIAESFVRLVKKCLGIELLQLKQDKITHTDGTRELGDIISDYEMGESVLAVDDTATGGPTKIEGWQRIVQHYLRYAGLIMIAERDPLASALVRERTGSSVCAPLHWLTIVSRAAQNLDLSREAVQTEFSYPSRLFEWNVAHNKLNNLPTKLPSLG